MEASMLGSDSRSSRFNRARALARSAHARRIAIAIALASIGTMNVGCGREAIVSANALPLKHVVIYRNGVGYFERGGHIEDQEVRFKMKQGEVDDFLASLAVMEKGGSSVRAAAFPLDIDDGTEDAKPRDKMTADEKKGLKTVVLSLDGRAHDLEVGYITESPVWRPSYRLVIRANGEADLQAWGIVENLSGEDWKDVRLSLVAGAPLAFEAQLAQPVIPERPVVTDNGEVIAAVPHSETSLRQEPASPSVATRPSTQDEVGTRDGEADDDKPADNKKNRRKRDAAMNAPSPMKAMRAAARGYGAIAPAAEAAPMAAPAGSVSAQISAPRNLRSLAAVAVEAGTTRYDLPETVTIPDKSATMVLLLSRKVPGEALFLFGPDSGVADSFNHPFRVARFANKTGGVLERGPIAVFEAQSFLGQGLVDPLPDGATATVPFALERSIAVEQERTYEEVGERVAKIENGQLTVERDGATRTKYRVRNGGDLAAKLLVKHPRQASTRLFEPPHDTEDNVGTHTALVPMTVPAHATSELVVDERATIRRGEDWFSVVADNAVKAYMADRRADRSVVAKLSAAWTFRAQIIASNQAREKLVNEESALENQSEQTRRNLHAIDKNKAAEKLRQKLTQSLGEMATRLDVITKERVEIESKLAELHVRFSEGLRDVQVAAPLPVP
jgi:hypothetical protein